jgi:hypothetical protein
LPLAVPDTTGEANRRSDLYTLGVVLYEMLVGQRCVPAGSQSEIMRAVINDARSHSRRSTLRFQYSSREW